MAFIGNTVQTQGFTPAVDYFSGNASTVTFTLSRPVLSTAQMIVSVANVVQNPGSAYTVSGSAITFTSAPPSGTNNIWVEYTSLITTYAAISQSPSVIGDITASGGYLATGNFNNSFIDGTIVDYVTGMGRITAGPADGVSIYNGGTSARNALLTMDSAGRVIVPGAYGGGAFDSSAVGIYFNRQSNTGETNVPVIRSVTEGSTTSLQLGPTSTSGSLQFISGNSSTERMRITPAGNLQFSTSNAGIVFNNSSATTNSTLNDYETGSWTPVLTSQGTAPTISYTARWGFYTKIGNTVKVSMYMYGSCSAAGTTTWRITGLPFTVNSSNSSSEVLAGGYLYFANASQGAFYAGGVPRWQAQGGTAYADFYNGNANTATGTFEFSFNGTYQANF